MDYRLFAQWRTAMTNPTPNFLNSMAAQPMNPAKCTARMTMPLDPNGMNMAMQAVNPGEDTQTMALPWDSKPMTLMMAPAKPQTYNGSVDTMPIAATYPMMQMIPMQMPTAGTAPALLH